MEEESAPYSWGPRKLQETFGTDQLSDAFATRFRTELNADDQAFISAQPFFFIATTDASGQPQCSYKGGLSGFVRIPAANRLEFPSYDGNGMHLTTGNLIENDRVGLLFIDFEKKLRLRVEGRATLDLDRHDDDADLWIEITVERAFGNCERYIHDLRLTSTSEFVPQQGRTVPEPTWKLRPWLRGLLPKLPER